MAWACREGFSVGFLKGCLLPSELSDLLVRPWRHAHSARLLAESMSLAGP